MSVKEKAFDQEGKIDTSRRHGCTFELTTILPKEDDETDETRLALRLLAPTCVEFRHVTRSQHATVDG